MAGTPNPPGNVPGTRGQEHGFPAAGTNLTANPANRPHPPAGFWVRLGAVTIDVAILYFLMVVLNILVHMLDPVFPGTLPTINFGFFLIPFFFLGLGFIGYYLLFLLEGPLSFEIAFFSTPWVILLTLLTPPLYFSLLESSAWQATLGKRLLGLVVTDPEGKRIAVIRAIGRFYAKWIYLVPLGIGFIGITFGMAGGLPRFSRDAEMFLGIINPEYLPVLLFLLLGIGLLAAGFIVGKRGLHDVLAGTRVAYRTPAHRDARDLRIILAGVIACALVVISIMTVLVFLIVTTPPYDPFHHATVAATAELQGDTLSVTWQGGPDNDLVAGYVISFGEPGLSTPGTSMTYPGPDELYPPEPGNRTRFGAEGSGQVHVIVIVTMKDGRKQVVLDTYLKGNDDHPGAGQTAGGPADSGEGESLPASHPTAPNVYFLGEENISADATGNQTVRVSLDYCEEYRSLSYQSGNENTSLTRMDAATGFRFVLVDVSIRPQVSATPSQQAGQIPFMTPLTTSFSLCEGSLCIGAMDPGRFRSENGLFLTTVGSLYHPEMVEGLTEGGGLLVFEVPDHLLVENATVRFCPVNDPAWELAGFRRFEDIVDCRTGSVSWRLS